MVLFSLLVLHAWARPPEQAAEPTSIVVSAAQAAEVRQLLAELDAFGRTPPIAYLPDARAHLDCEAYEQLKEMGWVAVPYVIEQAARWYSVYDRGRTTAEARAEVSSSTLPASHITRVLRALPSSQEEPQIPQGLGIGETDCFVWLDWWQTNQSRFSLAPGAEVQIPPVTETSFAPHITTSEAHGLLDLHAVSATNRHIIQRGAAELGVEVEIGRHPMMSVSRTLRVSGVDFEGLLTRLAQSGFSAWEMTEGGYRVGKLPASPPRLIMNGWGIAMDRTAIRVGEPVQALVVVRELGDDADAVLSSALEQGRFVVSSIEGTELRQCAARRSPAPIACVPNIRAECGGPPSDGHALLLDVEPTCAPPTGEYVLRFVMGEQRTPPVPFEIYTAP